MATVAATDATFADETEETVMTGEAVALELRPTPFILAAAGAAIDWAVYFIGGILAIIFGIILPLSTSDLGQDSATLSAFVTTGIVLVLIVIPTAVELLSKGKSLGRLAVGARIVRDDGGAIGFRHAFIRNLLALVEIYVTFGGLAAIVGLLGGRSKRLGDLLAGTYSQYERAPRIADPLFGVPFELQAWALTADVARIPTRLSLRAVKFLRQAGAFTPTTRAAIADQLAGELALWVSPVPNVASEVFVAGVVASRRDREFRAHQLEDERLAQVEPALRALPHGFPRR
jgi:uncharacterized RDD family membrane protein YckC